jgi:hypothetical protein
MAAPSISRSRAEAGPGAFSLLVRKVAARRVQSFILSWMPSFRRCGRRHPVSLTRMLSRSPMARSQNGSCVVRWTFPMSNESIFRQAILNGAFTYTARPDPIPGDLRMSWGMAILILALFYSRARKSNFQKLQFLAHSVRIPEGREEVRGLLNTTN